MTKYFCDKCHIEVTKPSLYKITIQEISVLSVGASKFKDFEVCHDCRELVDLFMKEK